jgi:hypothetical protein
VLCTYQLPVRAALLEPARNILSGAVGRAVVDNDQLVGRLEVR